MAHLNTTPGAHDHTVSAYIIKLGVEPQLILHMHKKLGKLMPFGGHIEIHENPWQAIEHELIEESGFALKQLDILQPSQRLGKIGDSAIQHPYPVSYNTHPVGSDHFHTDINWAFVTAEEPANKPHNGETQDLVYVTLEELKQLTKNEIFDNVRQIGEYVFEGCLQDWQRIRASDYSH